MAKGKRRAKPASPQDESVSLLKHLVAIELWRGGLSQAQIRERLGVDINTVSGMLKGVSRELRTQQPE